MNNKKINSTLKIFQSIEMLDMEEESPTNIQAINNLRNAMEKQVMDNYVDEVTPSQIQDVTDVIAHIMSYAPQRHFRLVCKDWDNLFVKQHGKEKFPMAKLLGMFEYGLKNSIARGSVKDLSRYLSYRINLNALTNISYRHTSSVYLRETYANGNLLHAVIFALMDSECRGYLRNTAAYAEVFKLLIEYGININHEATKRVRLRGVNTTDIESNASVMSLIKDQEDYIIFTTLLTLRQAELELEINSHENLNNYIQFLNRLGNNYCRKTIINYFTNLVENNKGLCIRFNEEQIEIIKDSLNNKNLAEPTIKRSPCSMM